MFDYNIRSSEDVLKMIVEHHGKCSLEKLDDLLDEFIKLKEKEAGIKIDWLGNTVANIGFIFGVIGIVLGCIVLSPFFLYKWIKRKIYGS